MENLEILANIQGLKHAIENTEQYVKSVADLSKLNAEYLQKHEAAILKHSECLTLILEKLPALALGLQQTVDRELKNLQIIQAISDELIARTAVAAGVTEREIRHEINVRIDGMESEETVLLKI
jgi:hypothetical protein